MNPGSPLSRRTFISSASLATLAAAASTAHALPAAPSDLVQLAAEVRSDLAGRVLPWWIENTIDPTGGYALAHDARKGRTPPYEKQVVSQARMVWGFSLAHRRGLGSSVRDYLSAARHGVDFLRSHLKDATHGGYFFSVEPDGRPRDARKLMYGQAFVIYALVEYHRASGERQALDEALDLFRLIQQRAHDARHRGWDEHFERDWKPLPLRAPNAIVEIAGLKSANTHLHLMEAFAELYEASRDPAVRDAIVESLELNRKYFYPSDAARSAFHFHPDWKPVTEASSAGLSYGHNVEFAWLMIRAEEVLRRRPSWRHFHNHVTHTLRCGTDPVLGGIYNRGSGNQPATDRDKVWWAQAEMVAALTDGLRDQPGNREYADALQRLLKFMAERGTDPATGIWYDTVTADGQPKATGLAHSWKANYHDVRGLLKFAVHFGKR
jgi:mannobiose 2-epimerase